MIPLPTGTVTFVFTDIEGSTSMLQRIGAAAFEAILEDHHRIIREGLAHGVEVRTEGDAFFVAFASASDAVAGTVRAQQLLADHEWPAGGSIRVRMGLHTGVGTLGAGDYIGLDVHRAARIASAGHGGQILISGDTHAAVTEGLPGGITLQDLGSHHFKDLAQTERVFQVNAVGVPSDHPPIRSLDERPNNLPGQASGFVGREHEVNAVADLMQRARLVTLTGPGGTGKTRLAIRVASNLLTQYKDGVTYVPLDALRDHQLVAPSIATALGLDTGSRPPVEAVGAHLKGRHLLLVLDNFEHVLGAASDVAAILSAAPETRILITSQTLLRVAGEHAFAVPPLSESDAIALFTQRAQSADPDFSLNEAERQAVAHLADRLDGLPLAMELAAARVHVFGLAGLLARFEDLLELGSGSTDRPDRHHTLRAAIQWSYDLLEPQDQAALRALSVFDGGFTLDAAEAIAGSTALMTVASLFDRSFLTRTTTRGEVRFAMLDSIRRFCLEALTREGEADAITAQHAAFYASLAETARPLLETGGQDVWLDRLALELDNLRAVLRRSVDHSEPDAGLTTAGAAWRFFHRRGHLREAREWLEKCLALPGANPTARAEGLNGLAALVYWQGDYQRALGLYEELLGVFEELGEPQRVADTLWALSLTSLFLDDLEGGATFGARAKAAYEEVGITEELHRLLAVEAWNLWRSGHLEESLERWEEAYEQYQAAGDVGEQLQTQVACAAIAFQLGRIEESLQRARAVLDTMVTASDVSGTVMALTFLCSIVARLRPEGATKLEAAAENLRGDLGGGVTPQAVGFPRAREIAARTIAEDQLERLWSEGRELDLAGALVLARSLIDGVLEDTL